MAFSFMDPFGWKERLANTAYENKSTSTIRKDVEDRFKFIEKRDENLITHYRDDQQIYDAGINVINDYIEHLTLSKKMWVSHKRWGVRDGQAEIMEIENSRKEDAIKYLKEKKIKFRQRRHKVLEEHNYLGTGCYITSKEENKQQINSIAADIDQAEEEALKKIKGINAVTENENAQEESSVVRDAQGNVKVNREGTEVVRQKPMFTVDKNTGIMTFTDRSNPVTIHDALKGLLKGNNVYEIDYTNCKNPKIKQKMMQLTGGEVKCLITYNKEKGTYLIRNSKGETRENRALIYEGVTLKRDELRQWEARQKKKEQNAKLGNIDYSDIDPNKDPEEDPKLKPMVEQIPRELRKELKELGNDEYRKFIIENEKRLNTILKQGKAEQYELETEPVSKVSSGLMEVHFVNDYAEKDVTIRDDNTEANREDAGRRILGDKLYDALDSNEGLMKEYITKRVQTKRAEFEDLTVRENSLSSKEKTDIKEEEKLSKEKYGKIMEGIRLLNPFISNHRNTEGDSWLDNGDNYLAGIAKKVRDLEFSINESINTVPATEIEKEIQRVSDLIASDWANYVHKPGFIKIYKEKFKTIFLGTESQQIDAIDSLSLDEGIMDHTERSYLSDEIAIRGLEVNDETINGYLKNLDNLLSMEVGFDENGEIKETEQKAIIDELYKASTTGSEIISVLINHKIIPENWRTNNDIKKKANLIAEKLKQQEKVVNSYSIEMIKEGEAKEKLELEMKPNKTETDIQRLQALNYLENHPNEAKEMHEEILKKTKGQLKYGGVNNLVRTSLMSVYAEEGGGAKGDNAKTFNDIIGYGFWDLSDENAKIAGELLVELAILVAVSVATGGIGAATTAAILRGGALAARGARWINLATKLSKAVELSQKGYKGLSATGKIAKFGINAPGLLFEGTIFNNASKSIHAAFKGTSLDSLNFDPTTRENIETAAFLFTLGIGNQIAGKGFKIFDKTGKYARTKLRLNSSDTLKSIGKTMNEVGAEMGGMLIATEGINLTFGHEVVDPITGEVKNVRELSWPSNEEWATMIGMIIAFKAVKPGMWNQLTSKLNDGTLIICRTMDGKNPVIRNTKTGALVPLKDLHKKTDIIGSEEGTRRQEPENKNQRKSEENRQNEGRENEGGENRGRENEGGENRGRENEGRQNEGTETPTESNIADIKKALKDRITELENAEAEIVPASRQLERLKSKKSLTEKERKRMQLFEERVESLKKIIAERPQEIQTLKDLVKKYEESQSQQAKEETKRTEEKSEEQRRGDERETTYFDGKKSKFNITEETARNNSQTMDKIVDRNNSNDLAFLRDTISIQYKAATGKDCPTLTDQQLKTIIEAHKQLGELGNLTQGELLKKVRVLSENITDANFRRFLLESGFCGKGGKEGLDASFKKSLVDRDQFADTISKNRYEQGGYPKGKIEMRKGVRLSVDKFFKKHPDIKTKYQEALKIQYEGTRSKELSKIDVELAEQFILESDRYIEFGVGKAEKAEASYKALNEVYNGRVEKIVREDGSVVLRLKQEPAPTGGEVVPRENTEIVPQEKHEITKKEPSLLTTIENSNVPAVVGERLPATITLKGGEIVPTEKVMPPAVREKLNNALAVIEKKGGLPAVIEKHPEIIPVLPSKGIVPPYWLVPLLLIPGLHRNEDEDHSIIFKFNDDFEDKFDQMEENPKITGVELPTDITGPFDSRGDSNRIKAEIDTKFDDLIRANHIETPLRDNALILLRGVSSWTYKGRGSGEQYNKDLSLTRAEEFKKYLMQKFPELTEDNFVIDSHYQPDNIDEAQRFQGVSMGVVDMQKYGGISTIRQLIPSGQDGRVL